ncbi:MAG: lytic transglycosylase domain-containing protein, partial [Gammaproteobacteria bacterium]|nr:lytic transglycosylase domain-containing protein [Gammaproteobacteria bacterium]
AERLETSWKALDPQHNLRCGAAYLREMYDRYGDWEVAVGAYHNQLDQPLASAYRARVLDHQRRVERDLLREAQRAQGPDLQLVWVNNQD